MKTGELHAPEAMLGPKRDPKGLRIKAGIEVSTMTTVEAMVSFPERNEFILTEAKGKGKGD